MRTIRQDGEHELVINKSRFICALARVEDEDQARQFVARRRKLDWNARHHCTAYILGAQAQIMRSSDDGEPAGTAGVPMLEVLKHRGITDTVAVVTRYFGGVKLGAGGLIRAYGAAVSQALDTVGTVELVEMRTLTVSVDHPEAGRLDGELRRSGFQLLDVQYESRVRFHLAVAESDLDAFAVWLSAHTAGGADYEVTGTTVVETAG